MIWYWQTLRKSFRKIANYCKGMSPPYQSCSLQIDHDQEKFFQMFKTEGSWVKGFLNNIKKTA